MGKRKKSSDINGNYPVLGFRIAKAEKTAFMVEFNAVLDLLNSQPGYRRVNLKKNAVYLRALEIGLEHIKKRKSLG